MGHAGICDQYVIQVYVNNWCTITLLVATIDVQTLRHNIMANLTKCTAYNALLVFIQHSTRSQWHLLVLLQVVIFLLL